jgi:hypothetical protein
MMGSLKTHVLACVLGYASTVVAHGHVESIVVAGVSYQGYLPNQFPYMKDPPTVIGWATKQTDEGFVEPNSFSGPDIICHKGATPGGTHAPIAAGQQVALKWNTWPDSHHGPVIDYLAPCPSSGCTGVDKTQLQFFKIDAVGLLSGSNPGSWGSDTLIKNNDTWVVQIPNGIAPGYYVLRHEIIALHSAGQQNGAQAYPQCINLQITSGGDEKPSGTAGEQLYKPTDPGIMVNIYQKVQYSMPGPSLISDAVTVSQNPPTVTGTASTTASAPTSTGGGSNNGGGSGSGSSGGGSSSGNNPPGGAPISFTPNGGSQSRTITSSKSFCCLSHLGLPIATSY